MATGHALKGVPSWAFTLVHKFTKENKFTKASRKRVCPIVVCPTDLWRNIPLTKHKQLSGKNNVSAVSLFNKKRMCLRYANLDATTMKEISEEISKKFTKDWGGHPRLVPLMFPNDVVRGKVKACNDTPVDLTLGAYAESSRGEVWHFFDDIDPIKRSYKLRANISVHESEVMINNAKSLVYSSCRLKEEKEYDMLVFKWYNLKQGIGAVKDVPVYYCFDKQEKKIDYTKMFDMMENVNSFDDITPNWFYDEQTSALISFNVAYCVANEPVLNTVLFGGTRLGKSKILEVYSKMFKDSINSGSQQTIKGLSGSFYSDKPQAGAMMESKFIFLGDELFRTGLQNSSQNPDDKHILALLNGLIEMLEHSSKVAPSGKFSRKINFDKSFLATNNVRNFHEFETAFSNDPAPFNRMTFLLIPKAVEDKMRDEPKIPSGSYMDVYSRRLENRGLTLSGLAKMFMYMRHEVLQKKRVLVDRVLANKYMGETGWCHANFEKWEKFDALIKSVALFNYVFTNNRPFPLKEGQYIIPTHNDYRQAVDYLIRIQNDFKQIMGLP